MMETKEEIMNNNDPIYTARAESGHQWRLYCDYAHEAAQEARITAQSEARGIWPRSWVEDFAQYPCPGNSLEPKYFRLVLLEDGVSIGEDEVKVAPPEPSCPQSERGHYWVRLPSGEHFCIHCGMRRYEEWSELEQENVYGYYWPEWIGTPRHIPDYAGLPELVQERIKARDFDLREAISRQHWVVAAEVLQDVWDAVEERLVDADDDEEEAALREFRCWLAELGKEYRELIHAVREWYIADELEEALRGR
jgi:hypothetical protein